VRILVTGSRDWTNWAAVRIALTETAGLDHDVTVVHGGARGADTIASEIAGALGWRTEPHRTDWNAPCRDTCGERDHRRPGWGGVTYCPAAGDYRNQEMVDTGADVCLAFYVHGSLNKGTSDCARRAKAAGITVVRIVQE
jgi:hypothetical protein